MNNRWLLIWYGVLSCTAVIGGFIALPLYPLFGALTFLAVVPTSILALFGEVSDAEAKILVTGLIVYSTIHHFAMTFQTASMVGFDPDKYAALSNLIVESGEIPTEMGFYTLAPIFYLLPAMVSETLGIAPRTAFLLYIPVIGGGTPLLCWMFARRISTPNAALIAATIGASLPLLIRQSVWPVSQGLGVVFFTFALYTLSRSLSTTRNTARWSSLTILFLVSAAITHKLPVLVFGAVLIFAVILREIMDRRESRHES